tara:strand:+ start:26758 stop:26970 length:213 start_codon:yes stop_codon:yes gene_type:complete
MKYLESIDRHSASDIKRLCARNQGLTIDASECINGEILNEEVGTFTDPEKAAEMYFNRTQDVFGTVTFNY